MLKFEIVDVIRLTGNGEYIETVQIGSDSDTGVNFGVFVALSPYSGYHPDEQVFEIVFCITEAFSGSSEIAFLWDGRETARFLITKDIRRDTLAVIMACIARLIDDVQPGIVWMQTREADLPQKALAKYDTVARLIGDVDMIRASAIHIMVSASG